MSSEIPLPLPRHAATRPDHTALEWCGVAVRYSELHQLADDAARRLAGLGVGSGDRVAVMTPNRPIGAVLAHAVGRLGAVLVALNPRLAADEVAGQVAEVTPRALIYDPALSSRLSVVAHGVALVALPAEPRAKPILEDLAPADVELRDAADSETPLAIVFTSGTGGRPKGAVLTHGNVWWSAAASALRLGHAPADRWLIALPLCHVGGLSVVWRCGLYGTSVVLAPGFEETDACRALREDGITLASLVPTMLRRILDEWGAHEIPDCLRAVLLGGGPIPEGVLQRALDGGFPVCPTYGLTEATSQVATVPPGRERIAAGCAGPPLAATQVRIVDAQREVVGEGVLGEIEVRGPTVMAGYWDATAGRPCALADEWLATGDLGWLNEAGELFVASRRADLIVTGGENVAPAEVESALEEHPSIRAACVLGVPDETWGSLVVAVVELTAGAELAGQELTDFLASRLARYKTPRRYHVVAALPRTTSGKVERSTVRRLLERAG